MPASLMSNPIWIRRATLALGTVAALSIATSLIRFAWLLVDDTSLPAANEPVAINTSAKPTLAAVADMHLFGTPPEESLGNINAPQTSLNLELKGVFTSENPKESGAVVAEQGKPDMVYRIGDKLPGNSELIAVFENRILLKHNGKYETLRFPEKSSAGLPGTATPQGTMNIKTSRAPAQSAIMTAIATQQFYQDVKKLKTQDFISTYREKLAQDPKAVLQASGLESVAPGKAEGYRVTSRIPPEMLSQSGLLPGDVLLSVNGAGVGDITRDRALLLALPPDSEAKLVVKRGNQRYAVTYPLR